MPKIKGSSELVLERTLSVAHSGHLFELSHDLLLSVCPVS